MASLPTLNTIEYQSQIESADLQQNFVDIAAFLNGSVLHLDGSQAMDPSSQLLLGGNGTAALAAVTKTQLDTKLSLAGGTMTGKVTLDGDPSSALHAATKQYSDAKLAKAGGTMTGKIVLDGVPTSDLHPASKSYVDAHSAADTTASGAPTSSGTTTTPVQVLSANVTPQRTGIALVTVSFDINADASTAAAFVGTLKVGGVANTEEVVWRAPAEGGRIHICKTWHVAATKDVALALTVFASHSAASTPNYTLSTPHTALHAVCV